MRTLLLLAALSSAAFPQQAPQTAPTAQAQSVPATPAQSEPAPATQSAPAAATPPTAPGPAANPELPPATPAVPAHTPQPAAASAMPTLSPTDAYLYSLQPFNNARGAPNDLTEADQWALSIGIARAKSECELLKAQKLQGEDLLALGKLCILGQDFDPARQSLIQYVTLPEAKSPELAHLLLTKAFLGLHDVSSAESQVESLLSLFPYDASIHLGTDMVIDAAEESDDANDLAVAPRLTEQQLPHILDALAHAAENPASPVPPSLGDAVDVPLIVRDALRIADSFRRSGKPDDAAKILDHIQTAIDVPAILNSASFPVLQAALIRYDLYQQPSPVHALHGAEMPATSAQPGMRTIPLYDPDPAAHRIVHHINASTTSVRMLDDRTLVLVFSLAGPASDAAIHAVLNRLALDRITPGLKVVAVTSIAANVGQEEAPPPAVLDSIRAFRAGLPATLPVLLVPDGELKPFAIDSWPAALLVDGKGRILWLNTLTGAPGAIHQMERDMESGPPQLPN